MLAWTPAASLAVSPPYLKLAEAVGTPNLANSSGAKDKSLLLLNFVKRGETMSRWTKMTTVSILHVQAADTDTATRGVMLRLRATLKVKHAKIVTFDEHPVPPVSGYFEFLAGGETQKGIVYSPSPGFVTVAQVGAKNGGRVSANDVKRLKSVIGR